MKYGIPIASGSHLAVVRAEVGLRVERTGEENSSEIKRN